MNYKVIKGDLFSCDSSAYLVHCISADYALSAGIAKVFEEKYNLKEKLFNQFPPIGENNIARIGMAVRIGKVFNLITKSKYWLKPNYTTMRYALSDMLKQCEKLHIQNLAMPRIGCGLDKLEWIVVERIINEIFADSDITIKIYVK